MCIIWKKFDPNYSRQTKYGNAPTPLCYSLNYWSDVLVSPLRPVKRFADLSPDEVTDLFLCVHRITPVLQDVHSSSSLTIAIQDGKDAGQTVDHIHVHMLPRKPGDFDRNDDIYEKV